jgi:hypothetical protein
MAAVAGDLGGVLCVLAIGAAIICVIGGRTIAGRMFAGVIFVVSHTGTLLSRNGKLRSHAGANNGELCVESTC